MSCTVCTVSTYERMIMRLVKHSRNPSSKNSLEIPFVYHRNSPSGIIRLYKFAQNHLFEAVRYC